MDEQEYISVNLVDQVAYITLNRPEKNNAFNAEFITELTESIHYISSLDEIRAVILQQNGKHFSAGADLNYMKSLSQASKQENKRDSEQLFDLFLALYDCQLPTIALVHGASFGGSNGLIAACDFAIASSESTFSFSEVKLGLVPATIAPFVISKLTAAVANRYFITGQRFGAEEAQQIGLIQLVVDQDELHDVSVDLVNQILSGAPEAVKASKQLTRMIDPIQPQKYREQTAKLIAEARVGEEGQEGIAAFFEDRQPNWLSTFDA